MPEPTLALLFDDRGLRDTGGVFASFGTRFRAIAGKPYRRGALRLGSSRLPGDERPPTANLDGAIPSPPSGRRMPIAAKEFH